MGDVPHGDERLEDEALVRAAQAHAADAALAASLAALERSGSWQGGGIRSFGHWADIHLGIPAATAARLVQIGRRLEALPVVASAFRSGELSIEKVAAVSAVATAASDASFAEIARHGSLAQVRRICNAYRSAIEEDAEVAERRRCRRSVRVARDDDGLVRVVALLEPDEAAIVLAAIDARVEDAWRRERRAAVDDGAGAGDEADAPPATVVAPNLGSRRADALVELASLGMDVGPDPVVRGERTEVVVHVDAALLSGAAEHGRCSIDGVGRVPLTTVERMLCDGAVVVVPERDGSPLDWGRRQKTVSRRQRRALKSRDGGCRFPGCSNERFVDAHHAVPWWAGGETNMDNLVLLCPHHHRQFHEGAYTLDVLGGGRFTFRRPDGTVLEPPPLRSLRPTGTRAVGSPRAGDGGGRFDLDLTLGCLRQAS